MHNKYPSKISVANALPEPKTTPHRWLRIGEVSGPSAGSRLDFNAPWPSEAPETTTCGAVWGGDLQPRTNAKLKPSRPKRQFWAAGPAKESRPRGLQNPSRRHYDADSSAEPAPGVRRTQRVLNSGARALQLLLLRRSTRWLRERTSGRGGRWMAGPLGGESRTLTNINSSEFHLGGLPIQAPAETSTNDNKTSTFSFPTPHPRSPNQRHRSSVIGDGSTLSLDPHSYRPHSPPNDTPDL